MKIALCQMDILWEDKNFNKNTVLTFVKEASLKKCEFIIFPEMTLTGFSMDTLNLGEGSLNESPTVLWFSKISKEFGINIAFGYIEKFQGKAKNNLVIVSSQGKVMSSYSKIHPFSFGEESEHYLGGSEFITTFISGIKFGSTICYDLRFPELFQILSKDSHCIIVIASWPRERSYHWTTLLKARAIENQCYILGVNRVGASNGLTYCGDSMVVSPLGDVLCHNFNNEGLVICNIVKSKVENLRKDFKVKLDRKENLYTLGYKRS
ncbi:nitrilase-related carbon-nitrogen hydrolase [Clostridium sp.]|uniref:nitrilase-related carbon-nitrogen hydrolase n=1 Tax=Clostridium sp. TaxID=1506 RepID=UPI003464B18D